MNKIHGRQAINSLTLKKNQILNFLFQISGGKKPKKGQFNGFGTLIFTDVANDNSGKLYGVRNRKCLKVSNRDLKSISGHFEHDEVMVGKIGFHRKFLA